MGTMARWIKIILVCTALLYSHGASAEQWLALTVAPDGTWGAAAAGSVNNAMVRAIAQCKDRSPARQDSMTGCGALLRTAQNGWGVAEICGTHRHVSVERTLADAEFYLRAWKLSMQYEYGVKLAECRRVVTVGPDGDVTQAVAADGLAASKQ
jgi:hypothetical protein